MKDTQNRSRLALSDTWVCIQPAITVAGTGAGAAGKDLPCLHLQQATDNSPDGDESGFEGFPGPRRLWPRGVPASGTRVLEDFSFSFSFFFFVQKTFPGLAVVCWVQPTGVEGGMRIEPDGDVLIE